MGCFVIKAPWLWKVKGQRSPKCNDQCSLVLFSTLAENFIKIILLAVRKTAAVAEPPLLAEVIKSQKRRKPRRDQAHDLKRFACHAAWRRTQPRPDGVTYGCQSSGSDGLLKCCQTERATCYCSPTNGGKARIFCKTSQAVFSPTPTALVFIADTLPLLHSAY